MQGVTSGKVEWFFGKRTETAKETATETEIEIREREERCRVSEAAMIHRENKTSYTELVFQFSWKITSK